MASDDQQPVSAESGGTHTATAVDERARETASDAASAPDAPAADTAPSSAAGGAIRADFNVGRRGYDRDEVDAAIRTANQRIQDLEQTVADQQERLINAMKRPMLHELDEAELLVLASDETSHLVRAAKARAAAVEEAAAANAAAVRQAVQQERDELLGSAKQALDEAKEKAENLVDDANQRASTTVDESERRAKIILTDANERSDALMADSQRRAETLVTDAQRQADTIVADADKQAKTILKAAEERYEQIRQTIAEHRKQLREELDSQREELQQIVDSLRVLRQEFSTSFQQVSETMDQVRNLSGMLWRFGEPVQRAEGFVERVFEQLGEASLPPRHPNADADDRPAGHDDTESQQAESRAENVPEGPGPDAKPKPRRATFE